MQRRRRAAGASVAALALLAAAAGGAALLHSDPQEDDVPSIAGGGPMDLSKGLRAFADPGRELRMGGRSFPARDLEYLDTDAAATSYGMVFFRGGRPFLLGSDGDPRALWTGPVDDPAGWHPTAKADPQAAVVAFAVRSGDKATVVVRDLTEAATLSLPLDCGAEAGCAGVVVDGVDSGTVFVRTHRGTFRWEYAGDKGLQPFAGPRTRVADVRNKTVLYAGPRPTVTVPDWTYVPGAIDAELTLDGQHVIYWSPVLKPVAPGGRSIHLDVPEDAQFFTLDTDGSVLAATTGSPARFFDCELPSGACEEIGRMRMTGGDPMFVGNDM